MSCTPSADIRVDPHWLIGWTQNGKSSVTLRRHHEVRQRRIRSSQPTVKLLPLRTPIL